ncbi:hypothetical protein [Chryseobacterium lathyri]|jgi:hypothetical protein|uniref:Uncharacterized protein n=1 Tax=Chryseobacterium lathyri TaxID=395933 RepID=A0A511YG90_9FLAO|nr:hypothetical protein [Chryseobacterium lathyri]GEN74215.1 hypothetical protein CLA01_42870 [Chryseobacterium lathyri]
MEKKINAENKAKNGVTLNYDLFKSKKENGKYHKDNNKRKEQN